MLEVIDKGSCSDANPAPLLFVHGSWHGAWCWDAHFLDFFADKGYRALAVSLRGHGKSPTSKPLHTCSIADYVDDVASVADRLPTRPVVIGHSLGGDVVQKYLESHQAPAGVLLASFPPQGIAAVYSRFARRHPWLTAKSAVTGDTMAMVGNAAFVREYMFSPGTPESVITDCVKRVQQESWRALNVDATFRNLPRPEIVTAPVLVLGAECDGAFTADEVRATARAYRTEAEFFPNMGHDMMLEPGWAAVAERIHAWLQTRDLRSDDDGTSEQLAAQ
jgi:pimeloyl-ACP methyl ester carboxylesterase